MKKVAFLLPFIALVLVSCLSTRHRSLYPIHGEYTYSVPRALDDGLETGSIEGTLFDDEQMSELNTFFIRH